MSKGEMKSPFGCKICHFAGVMLILLMWNSSLSANASQPVNAAAFESSVNCILIAPTRSLTCTGRGWSADPNTRWDIRPEVTFGCHISEINVQFYLQFPHPRLPAKTGVRHVQLTAGGGAHVSNWSAIPISDTQSGISASGWRSDMGSFIHEFIRSRSSISEPFHFNYLFPNYGIEGFIEFGLEADDRRLFNEFINGYCGW